MPKYCVNTSALSTGEHIVHRLDRNCSLNPLGEHRLELGLLSNDEGAIREAGQHFRSVDGCPECIPEHNNHSTTDAINAAVAALITVSNM